MPRKPSCNLEMIVAVAGRVLVELRSGKAARPKSEENLRIRERNLSNLISTALEMQKKEKVTGRPGQHAKKNLSDLWDQLDSILDKCYGPNSAGRQRVLSYYRKKKYAKKKKEDEKENEKRKKKPMCVPEKTRMEVSVSAKDKIVLRQQRKKHRSQVNALDDMLKSFANSEEFRKNSSEGSK